MNVDFLGAFFIGFLGAAHCVGMCGGIASAMSLTAVNPSGKLLTVSLYNIGRLTSYALFGLIVGGAVSSASAVMTENAALNWLRLLSAVVMIVLALYLGKWWQGLSYIEKGGQCLWKLISPWATKLLPLRSPLHALPLGFLWGWLPCGLVYSTITWAAVSGSAVNGALIMLAFGLGTLPSMLLVGVSASYVSGLKNSVIFRQAGAMLLLAYGVYVAASTLPLLT